MYHFFVMCLSEKLLTQKEDYWKYNEIVCSMKNFTYLNPGAD